MIVKAETAESYGLSRPLEVTQRAAGDQLAAETPADATHTAEPSAGKLYVLAIGAGPEPAADKPSVLAQDAQRLAAALRASGARHFDAVVARTLADGDVNRQAILDALDQLGQEMTLADTAVIYYAGADSTDATGHYQLGASLRPGPAESSGAIPAADFAARLAAIAGHLLLVLDLDHTAEPAHREAGGGFCSAAQRQDGAKRLELAAGEWIREILTEDYGVVVVGGSRRSVIEKAANEKHAPARARSSPRSFGRCKAPRANSPTTRAGGRSSSASWEQCSTSALDS